MKTRKFSIASLISIAITCGGTGFAFADECKGLIDWQKLNLSTQQQQQVQNLEAQWNRDYMELQPAILEDQRKLTQELSDSRPDPVEVMALQQSIARKQEQLRATATANYLRKRQCLNEDQCKQMEDMLHQALADRRRNYYNPNMPEGASPDQITGLWRRVQTMWARMGQ
jgi:hypothetical protein